jgi:hypothetical protein
MAPNHNKDYSQALAKHTNVFKRKNGPLTQMSDALKTQGFISHPFKK